MENLNGRAIYGNVLAKILSFAALAMGVAAGRVLAQDTIAGKFTLNELFAECALPYGESFAPFPSMMRAAVWCLFP